MLELQCQLRNLIVQLFAGFRKVQDRAALVGICEFAVDTTAS